MTAAHALGRIEPKRIVVEVVVLTDATDPAALARRAAAGARASLLEDASVKGVVATSETVDEAGTQRQRPPLTPVPAGPDPSSSLTQRETDVLELLARGRQPKQIAHDLGITVNTCRGYVKNILAKLDAHSALEAVLEANRRGIVTLPGS